MWRAIFTILKTGHKSRLRLLVNSRQIQVDNPVQLVTYRVQPFGIQPLLRPLLLQGV